MVRKNTPPWNGLSGGPMMVACQWKRSSPTGPAEHCAGGSRPRSCSSLLILFSAITVCRSKSDCGLPSLAHCLGQDGGGGGGPLRGAILSCQTLISTRTPLIDFFNDFLFIFFSQIFGL